jgi:hypothetical protein
MNNPGMNNPGMNKTGVTPRPALGITGPVLLVVAGGAVSQAAIARTAELAAGAPVTVVGVCPTEISRTDPASSRPLNSALPAGQARQRISPSRHGSPSRHAPSGGSGGPSFRASAEPEQVRRTVALAMSILEDGGVMATGHVVVTAGSPARAVARLARACGARVVILDQSGPSVGGQSVHNDVGRSVGGQGGTARGGAGTAGLMAELRRRIHGSGIVVLAETGRRGGRVSA